MNLGTLKNLLITVQEIWFCFVLNIVNCSCSYKLNSLYTVFTWQKLYRLEHPPFQSEVHHQMSHTITDLWFQRDAERWSHCDSKVKKAALAKCILHCLTPIAIFKNSNQIICIVNVKLLAKILIKDQNILITDNCLRFNTDSKIETFANVTASKRTWCQLPVIQYY